jgi:hypothetical protein
MKKILYLSLFCQMLCLFVIEAWSQPPGPRPIQPGPGDRATFEMQRQEQERQRKMDQIWTTVDGVSRPNSVGYLMLALPTMDKKTRDRIHQMREVDSVDLNRFQGFLRTKNSGIFRLYRDHNCAIVNANKVDDNCVNLVPMSSYYSFRKNDYVAKPFQDIGYMGDFLISAGFCSQGILVSLGDVPIDKIGLADRGLKFLVDFKPETDAVAATKVSGELNGDVGSDGFIYSRSVAAKTDTTYALRVIAYKAADSPRSQILGADKREDIIVAFRIIKKDDNGALTIVWKRLRIVDAPKMTFPKS